MNHVEPLKTPTRRRGIALVVTVSVLALATILLLAMFSVTESEYKSTQSYAAGQNARLLGENAVNIVMNQIQAGSAQTQSLSGREFHATQPGAVRRYTENGAFYSGHKLYSDSEMVVTTPGTAGETAMAQDVPPRDWDSNGNKGRYVDLNEPAVTTDLGGNVKVSFPIVDPRAFENDPQAAGSGTLVEGFSYYKTLQSTNSDLNGVVLPGSANTNDLRLPMPVEWMYVLKDGTLGTLDEGNRFRGAGATQPTVDNPIVGRFAFWADDETCKININTASEPTFWGTPYTYHERAHEWAEKPPTMGEYQRFPGHPATVALSTVLFPNQDLDMYGKPTATKEQIIQMKEAIYQIMPKINNGGSMSGTMPYAEDDNQRAMATNVQLAQSIQERLYASLDELLFAEQPNGGVRSLNDLRVNGRPLITPELLERSRFFLTANSRAPEFSMLGVPRVAMWPVADESLGIERRSVYDKLIAFCATLDSNRDGVNTQASNSYYFRRKDAHSTTTDIGINRNSQLLQYLYQLMGSTYPRGPLGSGGNFVTKYGDPDARQILINIFDYVRATNLYDSYMAPKFTDLLNLNGQTQTQVYTRKDQVAPTNRPADNQFKTYTEPRYITRRTTDVTSGRSAEIPDTDVANSAFPGHGQVSPSHWRVGSMTYMGFARSVSISEAALQFICTADGRSDSNSFRMWNRTVVDPGPPKVYNWTKTNSYSGGKTAEKIDPDLENRWDHPQPPAKGWSSQNGAPREAEFWYSNYPPFPSIGAYGTSIEGDASNEDDPAHPEHPKNPANHPGFNPANWNVTLDRDSPLSENQKRIQAILHLEIFCPMVGWTKIVPELSLVLDGSAISSITLNGAALWSTTANLVVKTEAPVFENYDAVPVGSTASFRNFVEGHRCRGTRDMPNDPGYVAQAGGSEHADMLNMDLTSSFITIDRRAPMEFEVPTPIKLDIYDDHNWQGKEPIQTVMLQFPSGATTVRPPDLVVVSTERRRVVGSDGSITTYRACDAPHWWAFSYAGALNRYNGNASRYVTQPTTITPRTDFGGANMRCLGRLRGDTGTGDHSAVPSDKYRQPSPRGPNMPHTRQLIFCADGPNNSVLNDFGSMDNPTRHHGTDVVRSIIPKYGDYRLLACRRTVPGDMWMKHPLWDYQDIPMAHNLTSYYSDREAGFDRSGQQGVDKDPSRRLVKIVSVTTDASSVAEYPNSRIPDMPHTVEASASAVKFRDFDNAVGPTRDGPYVNKPDEGNFQCQPTWIANAVRMYRGAYFHEHSKESASGDEPYFTPNRMIASAGMFGSLPTGVWGGQPGTQADADKQGVPWRTLLFRPEVTYPSGGASHAGNVVPRDHYLLDLFFMPVVEPYAISEPLSVAGRINVNYQMVPFTHIKRATGLHAVMKGEIMTVIPKKDANYYLAYNDGASWPQKFWEEPRGDKTVSTAQTRYWHRKINIAETLKQFDDRFNMSNNAPADGRGLFRSATQICEIHLVPSNAPVNYINGNVNPTLLTTDTTRKQEMGRFWEAHSLTGDNNRERPYTNIYPRITSRSNTFRVHMRAQAIRKARSTDPTIFVPNTDSVLSEYRGSTLIERYIDPNDSRIPEYADLSNPLLKPSLDSFYRFRVLENKRFVP